MIRSEPADMGAATSGVYSADEVDVASASTSGLLAVDRAEGFAAMYRLHAAFTWGCLRRLGVPPGGIDDAMQELWVTAHRRLDTLRNPAVARAWLYGIARRVASHHRRTEARHRRKLDAWGDTAPTHAAADRESSLIVEAILASLDERVREAFVLSELEGWTAPEIAAATGANTNTIYWRVRTARTQLQTQLGDRDLDAEVIQLRAATKAPRRGLAHCWMVLAPKLGAAPIAAGIFAGWSAAKLALVGAAVTVVVASGVEIGARASRSDTRLEPAVVAATPAVVEVDVDAAPTVEAAVLPATTPPIAAVSVAPAIPSTKAPRTAAPTVAAEVTAPVAVAIDLTADDARLLADAKLALTQGRIDDARALVDAHHRRFAHSKLADLRDAIDVALACRGGDLAAVEGIVAAARGRGADAGALGRLRAACPPAGP